MTAIKPAAKPRAATSARTKAAPGKPGPEDFSARLIAWQKRHGRNDLPWQGTRDAYRIWLSEIMLQQTQVGTVIPYYRAFLERFPDVASLAAAELDAVLRLWSGLGYYSRARNLHRAAQQVVARYGGQFPRDRAALESLPGVGRSTAAAIAAFAYGGREAILDGNVKRVLARHFAVAGFPEERKTRDQLWLLSERLLPARAIAGYTQALMDLGATVCMRTPVCSRCPVSSTCAALAQDAVAAYPAPRPRRQVPVRQINMLMLLDRGELMLEQRPPAGIWGGLWSFPEFAVDEDVAAACRARFGLQVSEVARLPELKHSFTHFTLRIRPLVCRVQGRSPRVEGGGTVWLTPGAAAAAAVPVPVRKLLARLAESPNDQAPSRQRAGH